MSDTYEDFLAIALSDLQAARHLLNAEIAAYPTPISGSDPQFNRLLDDRTRIANAIKALYDDGATGSRESRGF